MPGKVETREAETKSESSMKVRSRSTLPGMLLAAVIAARNIGSTGSPAALITVSVFATGATEQAGVTQ
jgi:hypothetical protein